MPLYSGLYGSIMNKDDLKWLLIQLVNEIGYESFSDAKFDSLLHDNHHLRLTKCYDWKYANLDIKHFHDFLSILVPWLTAVSS